MLIPFHVIAWCRFSSTCAIVSRVRSSAGAGPPRVVAGYRRQIQHRAGTTMRLECPVRAEPAALVSWSKDSRDINIAWDRHRVVVVTPVDPSTQADTLQRPRQLSQLKVL